MIGAVSNGFPFPRSPSLIPDSSSILLNIQRRMCFQSSWYESAVLNNVLFSSLVNCIGLNIVWMCIPFPPVAQMSGGILRFCSVSIIFFAYFAFFL